jgi:hypothetical protein
VVGSFADAIYILKCVIYEWKYQFQPMPKNCIVFVDVLSNQTDSELIAF